MNHCQVTLNTDQTLKQSTTSDDYSRNRPHYRGHFKCILEKTNERVQTEDDLRDGDVLTEELHSLFLLL